MALSSDASDLTAAMTRIVDVAAWLGHHGIAAEPMAEPAAGNDVGSLAAIADVYQADLIVAGAYGHSQIREALLGGVTKDLLLRSERIAPLSEYLAHEARAADLVLSGPDTIHSPLYRPRYADIGGLLMQSGRPLLVVPEEVDRLKVQRVVVAWKGQAGNAQGRG